MYRDLDALCIGPDRSVRDAVALMDRSRRGIVLVVDQERRLVGTITDGDVRRAALAGVDFQQTISALLMAKARVSSSEAPIAARLDDDRAVRLNLLKLHRILHLPIVDNDGRVVGLVTRDEFLPDSVLPIRAVVMAGGAGNRLRPLTEETPKPMLPVNGRPLMEITLEKLRDAGITRVNLTTHHRGDKIVTHFGDGHRYGVELSYLPEEQPLGTAGGLGLMDAVDETLLVINGDILTQLDFRAMLAYHREHAADLTVGVREYALQVPFGVVECDGATVRSLTEKPEFKFLVNAGIYLLEPVFHQFIAKGERLDMTELIQRFLRDGRSVVSFPIREYWLDIGEPLEYARAQRDSLAWETER